MALRGLFLIDPGKSALQRNPRQQHRPQSGGGAPGIGRAENRRPVRSWLEGRGGKPPPGHIGTRGSGAGGYVTRAHLYDARLQQPRSVKEFLRQGGISYEEINLAEDKAGQAFMESRGYTGLPVTVIGAEEIVGYNMPRIKAALGLSGANEVK